MLYNRICNLLYKTQRNCDIWNTKEMVSEDIKGIILRPEIVYHSVSFINCIARKKVDNSQLRYSSAARNLLRDIVMLQQIKTLGLRIN